MELTEKHKQLAKFITENGGWKDLHMNYVGIGAYTEHTDILYVQYYKDNPTSNTNLGGILLSKEQYLDWYYPDEKENQLEHDRDNNTHATKQSNNPIEQIIKEYFEIKETIETKQKELDVLKDSLDTKYKELVEKGKSLNVSISIVDNNETTKTEELVITDWRDLKIGDIIWWGGDGENKAGHYGVVKIEDYDYDGRCPIYLGDGVLVDVDREHWRFVSRPS